VKVSGLLLCYELHRQYNFLQNETGAANMVVTKDKLVNLDLEGVKRGTSKLVLAAALLSIAGCSTPDWVNPVNWFEDDGTSGPIESNQPAAKAEDGEYPKLGSTPPIPGQTVSIQEAETIENGLKADRQNAQYTDEKLRADTAVQPLPKPKPVAPPPEPQGSSDGPATNAVPAAPVATTPLSSPSIATPQQTTNGLKLMPQAAPVTSPQQAYATQVPGANTVVISGNGVEDVFQKQLAASAATTTTLPANTQFQSFPVSPLNNSAVSVAPIIQDTYNQPVALGFGASTGVGGGGFNTPQSGVRGTPAAILYFETGSSRVGQGDMNKLRGIAQAQQNSGATVKVVGHASSRTRELPLDRHMMVNLRMSQERSTNVVQTLIKLGVPSQKIVVEARSDSEPLTREAMPSDEAKNRRTEIFLVN
jgi:outer membrane protein OmpA-like peptidoglycan-associated protein